MKLSYTPGADADLDAIHHYISQDNHRSADRVIARILQAVAILETFPQLGRPGALEGTREFPISGLPYFAVYRIQNEAELDVIAIMHGRRQYPA